jgi:hypothetical protein
MPRAKKFKGPLLSPLAIKFDAMDTHQPSSPFLKLIPEIRNLIYDLVLPPTEPPTIGSLSPFSIQRKLSLSLLSTCRQIYLDTHQYSLQTNMHLDTIFPCRQLGYSRHPFPRLVDWQKSTIDEIHLIIELCHICFHRGPFLRVLLSRASMAAHLYKLHLYFIPEVRSRFGCRRAKYWDGRVTLNEAWDLKNFLQLQEITIEFALGSVYYGYIDFAAVLTQARTWCFEVGGNRVLRLDTLHPTAGGLVPGTAVSAHALRWI